MRGKWAGLSGVVVAPLFTGLALWACGLNVAGTDVSEIPDAMSIDGTSNDAPADDSSSSDGPATDGPATDGPASDAGMDATTDALDAGPDSPAVVTFCTGVTPAPTFCADFDDPADASPSAGWTSTSVGAGTSVTLTTTPNKSAPRALQSTSTQGNAAYVARSFPMSSQISVAFDVRFAALPAASAGVVSAILLTPPTFPGMDIYFFANGTRSYFQEYGDDYSANLTSPSLNVWHHVVVTIVTNGAVSSITASMDNTDAWTNHTLLHPWPTPTTATLRVGTASLYQITSAEAFVDNVVVRVQ